MAGERVLVVDDNAVNRRLLQVLLHSRGYEVCEAASAPEAFATLRAKPPHLILMDLRWPGMDGLTATRTLKADPATREIPIVAVTSYAMKRDEKTARAAGMLCLRNKTDRQDALLGDGGERVEEDLSGSAGEREIGGSGASGIGRLEGR